MAPTAPCDVCGIRSTNTCAKCKSAFYCSVDHQKLFWMYHKLMCGLENSNFSFFPMPDLVEMESLVAVHVYTALSPNHAQSILKFQKKAKDDTKIILPYIQTKINEHRDPAKRNAMMTLIRATILSTARPDGPMSPYYSVARIQQLIQMSKGSIVYSFLFHRQLFNYSCLWFLSNTITNREHPLDFETIFEYMKTSVVKLGETVEELEIRNGMDRKENVYRYFLNRCLLEVEIYTKMLGGLIDYEDEKRMIKEHEALLIPKKKIWFKE